MGMACLGLGEHFSDFEDAAEVARIPPEVPGGMTEVTVTRYYSRTYRQNVDSIPT